jgi:hypothetical protein
MYYSNDSFLITVKIVEGITLNQHADNKQANGHANGESKYIDDRKRAISPKISKCNTDIILKHSKKLFDLHYSKRLPIPMLAKQLGKDEKLLSL